MLAAPVPPEAWWWRALPASPPAWLVCGFLGFGLLWPWHTVLNSLPAIQLLFPASNGLPTYAALAFNSPQLPTHLLVLAQGHRSSPALRLRAGFLCLAAVLVALPLGARNLGQEAGDDFVFWCCALAGAATAVVESALFGSCATLGGTLAARATQAVLAGEGVAAVLANAAQLSLQAGASRDVRGLLLEASFFSAAAVMLLCAALAVPRFAAIVEEGAGGGAGAPSAAAAVASLGEAAALVRDLLRASWRTCLCVFATMAILFSVFPGVVAAIDYVGPSDSGLGKTFAASGSLAWSLLLFGIFSVTDLCGRLLASLRLFGGPGACGGREDDPDEQLFRAGVSGGGGGGGKIFGGGGLLPPDSPRAASPMSSPLGTPMRKSSSQALLRKEEDSTSEDSSLAASAAESGGGGAAGYSTGAVASGRGAGVGVGAGAGGGAVVRARADSGDASSVGGSDGAFGPLASAARRLGWAAPLMRRVLLLEALTWARLLYVPIFVLAANRQLGPLQDAIVVLAMICLGVSNGHAASLAMVVGPRLVRREQRDAASVLHVFHRVGGLWIGAVIGAAVEPFFRSQAAIE